MDDVASASGVRKSRTYTTKQAILKMSLKTSSSMILIVEEEEVDFVGTKE